MLKILGLYLALLLAAILPIEALLRWLFQDLKSGKQSLIYISKAPLLKFFTALFTALISYTAIRTSSVLLYYDNDAFLLLALLLFMLAFLFNPLTKGRSDAYLFMSLLGILGFLCPQAFVLFPLLFIAMLVLFNNSYAGYFMSTVAMLLLPIFFESFVLFYPLMAVIMIALMTYVSVPLFHSFSVSDYLISQRILNKLKR